MVRWRTGVEGFRRKQLRSVQEDQTMSQCLCGDPYCASCGPAQGNSKCPNCGAWEWDGGCVDPELCAERLRERADAEVEQLREIEEAAQAFQKSKTTGEHFSPGCDLRKRCAKFYERRFFKVRDVARGKVTIVHALCHVDALDVFARECGYSEFEAMGRDLGDFEVREQRGKMRKGAMKRVIK